VDSHDLAAGAVDRHDLQGWKDEIDVMRQTGVARIRPEVRDEVATYLAAAFGPDSATPESPSELPAYQKVKQERDYFPDEALDIVYVDYELTGDPQGSSGLGAPRQGRLHVDGDVGRPVAARSGHRRDHGRGSYALA
jgi:hypothetical protein